MEGREGVERGIWAAERKTGGRMKDEVEGEGKQGEKEGEMEREDERGGWKLRREEEGKEGG